MSEEQDVKKQLDYFDKRVKTIERDHAEMSQALRDFQKDFHLLVDTFSEVKEMLKSMYKTSQGIALFEQRYDHNREYDKQAIKRLHDRIDTIKREHTDDVAEVKSNQSRVAWLIMTAVVLAVLGQVLTK